jgi:hypothetical protein
VYNTSSTITALFHAIGDTKTELYAPHKHARREREREKERKRETKKHTFNTTALRETKNCLKM